MLQSDALNVKEISLRALNISERKMAFMRTSRMLIALTTETW
jgi:hypothetical protein